MLYSLDGLKHYSYKVAIVGSNPTTATDVYGAIVQCIEQNTSNVWIKVGFLVALQLRTSSSKAEQNPVKVEVEVEIS